MATATRLGTVGPAIPTKVMTEPPLPAFWTATEGSKPLEEKEEEEEEDIVMINRYCYGT